MLNKRFKVMKALKFIAVICGLLVVIGHMWTVIIGFQYGGFTGGILTLFLPLLSEIYWIIKMIGLNTPYVVYTILCTLVFLPIASIFK